MAQDDIQGQVVDGAGNPVSGAIVELTKSYQSSPDSRGNVFRTTTDSNGNYIFTGHQEGDGTTQEWHVSCYNHDGTAYVNSFNNPGVTADLPSNAIPDSVIHQYLFEDDSDTSTAIDSEGAADATINGATYSTDSYVGDFALLFDGIDDYVRLPFGDVLSQGDFTVIIAGKSSNTSQDNFALSNNELQTGRFDFRFSNADSNTAQFFLDGLSEGLEATTQTNDGSYHEVALRRSGDTYSLFVDGNEEDSLIESATPDDSVDYYVGRGAVGTSAETYHDGLLDDLYFSDGALTDQEIADYPYE